MVLILFVVGILLGWLVNCAADYLPRFAVTNKPVPHSIGSPAFLELLQVYPSNDDFRLRLMVELGSAIYAVTLYLIYDLTSIYGLLLGAGAFFALIGVIDLKYRLVLNVLIYPAFALAGLVHLTGNVRPAPIVLGCLTAFSIFALTAWLKPGQLGSGDIKLATLLGIIFGFPSILMALLIGGGAGGAVSLYLLLRQDHSPQTSIPYAPFLCLGAVITLLILI